MNVKNLLKARNKTGARRGFTALAITVILVGIVVFSNLLVSQLPPNILEFDLTDVKLYEVSDTSKEYLKTLEHEIEFIILSSDNTDERLTKYIYHYAALSNHISVTEVDPVVAPSVLDQYDAENNSLVVVCADTGKSTVIDFYGYGIDSLIAYEYSSSAGTFVESAFDAEGQITSAIDYVTGSVSETVYTMTGHGETELPESAQSLIIKSNLLFVEEPLDLLKSGIPDDCDLLICYKPTADLAADELEAIRAYMRSGGKVMLLTASAGLTHFNELMQEYGFEMLEGYVADPQRYFQQYTSSYGYFCIYPRFSRNSGITKDLTSDALLLYPRGMMEVTPARSGIETTVFMGTSEQAQLYTDAGSCTDGFYVLGGVSTEEVENGTSRFTVISAAGIIDPEITTGFSSMSNLSIFMNAVAENFDEIDNLAIAAKSLSVTYNSVSSYAFWSILFIALLPLAVLLAGLAVWIKRRRL